MDGMTPTVIVDCGASYRDTCEKCGKQLEIDQVHKCFNYLDAVNDFEARYNARMGRSGVVWTGD